jgi:ElaB/YqjD/DUF883 family membrane-anchored ribosome-binding protein
MSDNQEGPIDAVANEAQSRVDATAAKAQDVIDTVAGTASDAAGKVTALADKATGTVKQYPLRSVLVAAGVAAVIGFIFGASSRS